MTNKLSPRLAVLDDPQSLSVEAYRLLRVKLQYATSGTKPRSVLITSADVGAGKSTITANLGILLAQIDRSVLLVDADLRRPVLHTLLEVPNALGLSSYLSGRAMLEAVVTRTSVPNLSVMPSGPIEPNPSDLLSSQRMRDLLKAAAEQYDLVLVDSPPVLAASDAATLAPAWTASSWWWAAGLRNCHSVVPRNSSRPCMVGFSGPWSINPRRATPGTVRGTSWTACPSGGRASRRGGPRPGRVRRRGWRDESPRAQRAGQRASGVRGAAGWRGPGDGTRGAGIVGTGLRGVRHAGDRARDGLSRVPQRAVRLGGAGRALAAYGAAVGEISYRAGHRALGGLAGVSQAGAARLGGAGRAMATRPWNDRDGSPRAAPRRGPRTGRVVSRAPRGGASRRRRPRPGRVRRRGGRDEPPRRASRGGRAGRGVSGGRGAAGWRGAGDGDARRWNCRDGSPRAAPRRRPRVGRVVSRAPAAAVRLGGAGRALAACGAGVGETSRRARAGWPACLRRARRGWAAQAGRGDARRWMPGRVSADCATPGTAPGRVVSRSPAAAVRLGGPPRLAAYGASGGETSHRARAGWRGVSGGAARLGGAGRAMATAALGMTGRVSAGCATSGTTRGPGCLACPTRRCVSAAPPAPWPRTAPRWAR